MHGTDAQRSGTLLENWLRSYPASIDATVLYSAVLRKQKRYAEAEKLLSRNFQQWKENAGIIMEMALVKIGLMQHEEAARLLTPVLAGGQRHGERYQYLSDALLDMENLKESEDYFAKAMALQPNPYSYFRRARRYALLGETDKAFSYLDEAVAKGLRSKQQFEDDADLQVLKSDNRWKALMEKLK